MHHLNRLCWALLMALSLAGPAVAQVPPARNNAVGTLASGIDSTTTTIVLTAGQGAKFPTTAEGEWYSAIYNSTDYSAPHLDPNFEIVKITARSTDTLTVVRGQDGTTAVSHNTGGKTYTFFNGWFKISIDRTRDAITAVSGTIPNVVDCAGACATAVSGIGSNVRTLRVSGTEPVASNLSIGETITVWPIGAGAFNISGSVTLTIHSPTQVWAAPHQQIFTGAGTVAFTKPGTVYPQWWGAKCDGTTDDGPEIQAAYDSLPSGGGGTVELAGCAYKLNQEILVSRADTTVRLEAGAVLDIATIGGTGSGSVHDTANVLAAFRVAPTAARVRITGGRITGTATVSGKKTIGILIAGATQTKVGGIKIENLHAGIWIGGNAVEPTLQNVELASNEHNLILGYKPTSSASPQVTGAALRNVISRNGTVGDCLQFYSYTQDTLVEGGRYYSCAGAGINGTVGGSTVRIIGVSVASNAGGGLLYSYTNLSGTTAGKLGFANKLTVIGSRFSGNTGAGVSIQLPDYALFSAIGGIEDVTLDGNLSELNTGAGYDLGLVRSSVTNNRSLTNNGDCFVIRSNKSVTYSGNQAWDCGTGGDNRRGFHFTTAATTGSTPPNSTLLAFVNNQAGDTRSGGSRTMNFAFDLLKLDTSEVTNNHGTNANTADWTNVNGLTAVAFGNNRGAVTGSNVIGLPVGKYLSQTATWDPASLLANEETSTVVTVTGAAPGDVALCGHTQITGDLLQLSCHVSAADAVRVVLENISGSTVDAASGTLRVWVVKP